MGSLPSHKSKGPLLANDQGGVQSVKFRAFSDQEGKTGNGRLAQALLGGVHIYTRITKHVLDMGDAPPLHVPGKKVNLAVREIIRSELQTMHEAGVDHPSQCPYSSPIILVKKKDGGFAFALIIRS